MDIPNSPITIQIPLKAVVLYASYMSQSPSWENRKAPDYLLTVVGANTNPDTLVNVTIQAQQLADFAIRLTGENYGIINIVARSIFNNSPAIPGYTALFTQVVAKANGTSSEKDAAAYVVDRYNSYTQSMTDLYNQIYQNGLNFIHI